MINTNLDLVPEAWKSFLTITSLSLSSIFLFMRESDRNKTQITIASEMQLHWDGWILLNPFATAMMMSTQVFGKSGSSIWLTGTPLGEPKNDNANLSGLPTKHQIH